MKKAAPYVRRMRCSECHHYLTHSEYCGGTVCPHCGNTDRGFSSWTYSEIGQWVRAGWWRRVWKPKEVGDGC